MRDSRGFTLVEMLLSVIIIGMLVGLSLPLLQSFQTRNELDSTTQGVVEMLRRAQSYARNGNGDSTWGVHLQSGSGTLFKGASYASRSPAFDETVDFPDSFTVAGITDIVYSEVRGIPSAVGSITLTGVSNDTRTVTINGKGMVSY